MSLQVTGKHINVGDSFKSYVGDKIEAAVEKYVGRHLAAHVRVEKERGRFHTNCSVRLGSGLMLESTGEGPDAYASADDALEHLEKRLRRYKRRLKSRHHASNGQAAPPEVEVLDSVIAPSDEAEASSVGSDDGDNPVVVAETGRILRKIPVNEAVMQLDLTDDAFLVFRNAASGEINVVYRRKDGNIGWIDPATPART